MKYKAGDIVRCVKSNAAVGVKVGKVYTVKGFSHNSEFGTHIKLGEVCSTPTECVFELVESNPVLTPEEVFEHLRKGTELEYRREYRDVDGKTLASWRSCSNPQFANILNREWRVKPKPEVIELNGKKYREIID